MLHDVSLKPRKGEDTEQVVIIVHGLGDSSEGIITLGEAMQSALPKTEFVAPDAPFPCDFSPFGYQWFSAANWTSSVVLEGVKNAAPYLDEYIDHIATTRNMPFNKIALLGFSQGTMMSLYVAPRRNKMKSVACVLGYSGALIGGDSLKSELKCSPPVFLAHGEMDDVVPIDNMTRAVHGLREVNINVETLTCPRLSHSIDDKGLSQGIFFIRKHLSSKA